MEKGLAPVLTAELVGTFALVFVGAGAGAIGVGGLVGVALAHGLILLSCAYAFGAISGTHINPAVTIGIWLAGGIEASRAAAYVVVQLIGGILAALCLRVVLAGSAWADSGLGATLLAEGVPATSGLLLEALLTFFLVSAVLNLAIAGRGGNQAGIGIAATLTAAILIGGPLTGASLNPARSLGPALITGNLADLWLYFVGPIAGGLIAALLYKGVFADDHA